MAIVGSARITNGTATVTVEGLKCGVTYGITAGGTFDGALVGPRSSHGTVMGDCSIMMTPTTTLTTSTSMNSKRRI